MTNPEKWRIVGARADAWLDALHDTGVTTGVGDPTVVHTWIPDCSCDACDSGSQDALDELDGHLAGIVTGQFRRLQRGERTITVASDRTLQSSGGDSLLNVDRASQTPRAGASSPDRAGWPGSRPA